MDIKAITEYLGTDWTAVRERIVSALGSDISLLNMTNASILERSGKQMRPMLALLMAGACSEGGPTDSTITYAAASELLHNATLLHDDVADESDTRRGAPTIRSLMGPSVSVLVGDYWLVKAMELILDSKDDNASAVMRIFAKTLSDLAEGEMLQLQKAQSDNPSEDDYLRIIYNKTASLFEAASVSAAMSVGASDEQVEAARRYAVALGIAFQIQDDILDYSGTAAVGKPLGADILEHKVTLPLFGAMKGASEEKVSEIMSMISDIDEHPEYRDVIVAFVKENGGIDYAVSRLNEYVSQAVNALDVLAPSKSRDHLAELAVYTAKRSK